MRGMQRKMERVKLVREGRKAIRTEVNPGWNNGMRGRRGGGQERRKRRKKKDGEGAIKGKKEGRRKGEEVKGRLK